MNKKIIFFVITLVLFSFGGCVYSQGAAYLITPSEASTLIKNDSTIVLLDVRTTAEFKSETGHLKNAVLIPVQELENRINELTKFKKNRMIVYCRTGHRSTTATELLIKYGYNVKNMTGGITQWNIEKLPVVTEKN